MSSALDRQTLAKFLPTQEAIRAFEQLLIAVAETAPNTFTEILALIGSNQQQNITHLDSRIESLQQTVSRLNSQQDSMQRIEELAAQIKTNSRSSDIEQRIKNIENFLGL